MMESDVNYKEIREQYLDVLILCQQNNFSETKQKLLLVYKEICYCISEQSNKNAQYINKMAQYIQDNYHSSNFSLNLMADEFEISVPYLSHIFKEKTGYNISDYVWNLRFEEAKKLLIETDMSVKDITCRIGYNGSSSFIRKFKEISGSTPGEFRINNKT